MRALTCTLAGTTALTTLACDENAPTSPSESTVPVVVDAARFSASRVRPRPASWSSTQRPSRTSTSGLACCSAPACR